MLGVEARLFRQGGDDAGQGLVGGAHVAGRVLEARQQTLDLGALAAHLVRQQRVLALRRLQLRVQLRLVPREGRVQVRGEDGLRGQRMWSFFFSALAKPQVLYIVEFIKGREKKKLTA